jgi:hypothetical protein
MSKLNSSPVPVDAAFLKKIHIGSQLFHYPNKGSAGNSFTQSGSPEETLYSVIDLPTTDDVVMVKAFDPAEKKHNFSKRELLSGDWWHRKE